MQTLAGRFFHQVHTPQAESPPFEAQQTAGENCEFRTCHFMECSVGGVRSPQKMHTIRRSVFVECNVTACTARTVQVDDVTIENLKIEGGGRMNMFIVCGAVFRHVVFKGHIGNLKINIEPDLGITDKSFLQKWNAFYLDFYRAVDWAIDIRHADFKLGMEFHWVPGHLVLRNPETQVLVRRETLRGSPHKSLPLSRITRFELDSLLDRSPFDSVVLAAFPREREFDEKRRDFDLLRKEQLACPD